MKKLRNKKSGDIGFLLASKYLGRYEIVSDDYISLATYDSIAKLIEEWEDYELKEPLIKDEKIRKAVKAWAESIKAESAFVEKPSYEREDLILSNGLATISFPIDKPKELDFCQKYTIKGLCGEDE